MNNLRRAICASILGVVFIPVDSFSAGSSGESAKNSPRASAKLLGRLIINGSRTMAPMITEMAKRFQALHSGTQIEILSDTTAVGISEVRNGKATIGALTRALSNEERDLTSYPVARDGVCVIVHKDNPIAALTNQQLVDIYLGKIVNWNKVGGSDAAIHVMNGISGSGAVDVFVKYFKINYDDIRAGTVLGSSSERIAAVAEQRNAISYASVGEAERKMKAGVLIKLLPADGVSATVRALRSGNFPIARPLTLITKGTENELTKEFIRYVLSAGVISIIEKYDFVPYAD